MRKQFFSLLLALSVATAGFAQTAQPAAAADSMKAEIKSTLVSRLNVSDAVATKILEVEENFYSKLAGIEALGNIPTTQKEIKLNEAHTARREALLAAPLTGRQMEDAMEVVAAARRKYKR